jgi:SNF2 family DNA or RNA helicase
VRGSPSRAGLGLFSPPHASRHSLSSPPSLVRRWNPAAELQALDRTHRLGQHRSITATRYIVRGTVEERILSLQEKKRLVFEGTVGKDGGALAKLTEEDMRFLFG